MERGGETMLYSEQRGSLEALLKFKRKMKKNKLEQSFVFHVLNCYPISMFDDENFAAPPSIEFIYSHKRFAAKLIAAQNESTRLNSECQVRTLPSVCSKEITTAHYVRELRAIGTS